ALADPTGFAARLAARRLRAVAVLGDLGELGDDHGPDALLEAAGLGVGRDLGGRLPDAALVLSVGEPERELTDLLVHGSVPHLVLRLLEGTVVVGPLVVPGRTACLRCVDAHRADEDPLHPLLVATHHRAVRHDGVAEPGDAARVALGVAWAVRDLVTHLDGGRAACWSATVRIPVDLAALQVVRWLRHPACSCIWVADAGPSSTMAV
ncbi:hypothetical protein, partial [Marmoricola sp. RAF53]|uniref:hypothetical protein n=1 Tax=Marmoricola sp. RAF53 TaxID=3233059 RepID=UPI003F971F92